MKQIRLFNVYMSEAARRNADAVLTSDHAGRMNVTQGPKVDDFEESLMNVLATPYPPLTTNSCTSALTLALHLAGVKEGDEVISTPMTCTATSAAIVSRGARIVWADVDPTTGLIDPHDVHKKLTPATKAVMAVDWAGALPNYRLLKSFGCPVIEDAAHAFLAVRDGFTAESNCGDYVCWSFQAIKHLTTCDGGAILTPPDQYERAKLLRWYGLDRTSKSSFRTDQNVREAGYKFNMNDLNAAIGLGNIKDSARIVRMHRENAGKYYAALHDARMWPRFSVPKLDVGSAHWLYPILVDDIDRFTAFMAERAIEVGRVHGRNDRHHAYSFWSGPLPGVDAYAKSEVCIPVGWWLDEEDIDRVVAGVLRYGSSGG